jgi:hypothetical protein
LVARGGVPGARVVVGHDVPGVEVGVHGGQVEGVVVLGSRGRGDGELEVVARGVGCRVGIEGLAAGAQEGDVVGGLGGRGRVFPVDVEAVETPVCVKGGVGEWWCLVGGVLMGGFLPFMRVTEELQNFCRPASVAATGANLGE